MSEANMDESQNDCDIILTIVENEHKPLIESKSQIEDIELMREAILEEIKRGNMKKPAQKRRGTSWRFAMLLA